LRRFPELIALQTDKQIFFGKSSKIGRFSRILAIFWRFSTVFDHLRAFFGHFLRFFALD